MQASLHKTSYFDRLRAHARGYGTFRFGLWRGDKTWPTTNTSVTVIPSNSTANGTVIAEFELAGLPCLELVAYGAAYPIDLVVAVDMPIVVVGLDICPIPPGLNDRALTIRPGPASQQLQRLKGPASSLEMNYVLVIWKGGEQQEHATVVRVLVLVVVLAVLVYVAMRMLVFAAGKD